MKIGPLNDAALAAATAAPARAERGAASPGATSHAAGTAGAQGVAVTVSTAARSLDATAPAGSGIDEAKVAAVRAAIANGSFTVNPEAIADKLLANAQEVLSRTRS